MVENGMRCRAMNLGATIGREGLEVDVHHLGHTLFVKTLPTSMVDPCRR